MTNKLARVLLTLFASAFLSVFSTHSANAQVVAGTISGTVTDPSGAMVPGATVKAVNAATKAASTATTNSSGNFLLASLPVGTYSVSIAKDGFKTYTQTGITVVAAVDRGIGSIQLTVGSASETVEVSSRQALLETTQAQVSTSITNSELVAFPGLNANPGLDNFAVYLPGINATRDNNFSNTNGPGFSSNGLRGRANDQQVDGQNNNDNSIAGPSLFVASPLFVQDYQVITDNFAPEYGRNSGSVVNEVTKQGGTSWHGELVGTESNNYVDALSNIQKAFEGLTGPSRFNDEFTGGDIGGPVWRNNVFLYSGFDDEIVSSKTLGVDSSLSPTVNGIGELTACFPNSTAVAGFAKYSAFAIGTFNPTTLPGSVTTVNVPESGGGNCPVEMAFPERLAPNGSHEWDWDYRMDVVVNNSDRFFGRYLLQKLDPIDAFGDIAGGYPVSVPSLTQGILLDETHTISSSMVNDFRVSFIRANVQFGTNPLGTIPSMGNLTHALATVTIAAPGFLGFGAPVGFPQGRIIDTWQGQDNWSWFQGKNEWTAGVNYTYQRTTNYFFPFIDGQFTYADWGAVAANTPEVILAGSGDPVLDFREHDLFLYGGDDYKLRSNLTLNLGLTWTYFGAPQNLLNSISVKNETGPHPLFDPSLPLSIRTFPKSPSEKNLFGPSLGFAWVPKGLGWLSGNGNLVIRGGYRLAYDPAYYNIFLDIYTTTPLVLLSQITGANAASVAIPANPTGDAVRAVLAPFLQLGQFDPRDFAEQGLSPNFGADRVHEWSFGIQRQLNPHLVLETRYVGNHGFDLYQDVNANPYVDGLAASFPSLVPAGVMGCPANQAVVPSAVGRVHCNEGILGSFQSTGYSDYQGWQNEVRADNLFDQLTLLGNYTWSKTTDNTSEIFSTGFAGNTIAFAQNPFNVASAEHGLSGLDYPYQLTVEGVWRVPLYRDQHGVIGHALGGWAFGMAYQLVSGQPYTPNQEVLNTFTGGTAYDFAFNTSAVGDGLFETARPFVGGPSAPVTQVGIYAGDACALIGLACGSPPDTLLSYNDLNPFNLPTLLNPAINMVSKNQVRFIVNGAEADAIYGTPFGNTARNSVRDFHTNLANIAVFRTFKFNERVNVQARLDLLNAFNHPNYSTVGPFIEFAGVQAPFSGFGDPTLTSDGPRVIKAGLQVNF